MRKLFKYLKPYMKQSILAPLFKLIEVGFELAVPVVVASVIDRGIAQKDVSYTVGMCLLLAAFAFMGLACAVTAQYFAAKASVSFAHDIRGALYRHIQTLSYSQTDTLGASTLITRMTNDINQIQTGLNLTLRLLLRSPFVVFGAMIAAFIIDVKSASVFACSIPVLCAVTFFVMLVCIPMYKKVQGRLDNVLGLTRDNLTGVRVIRTFGAESEESAKFNDENRMLVSNQRKTGRISALLNPVTAVLINLAIILLIYTGAIQVKQGILTQGAVVALFNYMSQILIELIKLANLIINITKATACAARVQSVLDIKPEMTFPEKPVKTDENAPAVEFSGVFMKYSPDADEVLENITLTVPKGARLGIIGGTGSGKTSLINLIPRLYEATEGEIKISGVDVKAFPYSQLRTKVAVVPQKTELFSGTIRDNLTYGGTKASDAELYEALDIAQGSEFVHSKKGGLDAIIEQGGKNLSGGQRQRLTIARALARKPEILILDDSASALDYATDFALRKALKELNMTVIIVSQRVSAVCDADEIIVLDDGKIVGQGTEKQLLQTCAVYREIYTSQIKEEKA